MRRVDLRGAGRVLLAVQLACGSSCLGISAVERKRVAVSRPRSAERAEGGAREYLRNDAERVRRSMGI
jgi:hypothetical protein